MLIRGSWRAVHLSKFDVHAFTSQRKVEVRVKAVLQPEFAEFAGVTRVWDLDQTDPNAKLAQSVHSSGYVGRRSW